MKHIRQSRSRLIALLIVGAGAIWFIKATCNYVTSYISAEDVQAGTLQTTCFTTPGSLVFRRTITLMGTYAIDIICPFPEEVRAHPLDGGKWRRRALPWYEFVLPPVDEALRAQRVLEIFLAFLAWTALTWRFLLKAQSIKDRERLEEEACRIDWFMRVQDQAVEYLSVASAFDIIEQVKSGSAERTRQQ